MKTKEEKKRSAVALMAVVAMIAAAAVPIMLCDDEVADEAEAGFNIGNPLKAICLGFGLVQEVQARTWYALAGVDWGHIATAGDSDEVKAFARTVACTDTVEALSVLANTGSTLVDNENQTLPLTEAHMARAAEIAAATLWSNGAIFDSDAVLEYGGILNMLASIEYNTCDGINYGLRNLGDRVPDWKGSPVYSSIQTRIVWDGAPDMAAATDHASIIFAPIIRATQANNTVFVPEMKSGEIVIWAVSGGTITPADGGAPVTLDAGKNVIPSAQLPAGWYTLTQGTYAGILMPSSGEHSAAVSGGAIIDVDGTIGTATVTSSGMAVEWGGTAYPTQTLGYKYSVDGKNYYSDANTDDGSDPIGTLLAKWDAQVSAVADLIYASSVAGQTMWTIAANAREANVLLSPSSISAKLVGMGYNAEQSYALYVAALSQIAQYYSIHGAQLDAGLTQISSESLSLYCFGTLYNSDGTVLMSDVVYTPYVYVDNMVVKNTGFNTFTQDGTIMIWSTSAGSLAGFTASDPAEQQTVIMPKGSYFSASEISYNGAPAESVSLKVRTIEQTEGFEDIVRKTIEPPKVLEASTLVMIIMLELAVIFVLLGWKFGMPLFFIIAAIIAVVALIFPEPIAKLLVGVIGK